MERLYNNINNGMCRCCASEGTFKDLSSKYRWMGVEEVYADMLQECFDVTLSYPEENPEAGICEVCITQLRNAANFKKQVLNTEEQFKKMLQNKNNIVKVEVSPPEDDGVQFTDEDNNLSNDDFSSTEYEVPIKTESEEGKSRKRSAKAGPSRSKQPKLEGDSTAKRNAPETIPTESSQKNENDHARQAIDEDILKTIKLKYAVIMLQCSTLLPFTTSPGYKCFYCNRGFNEIEDLKAHTVKSHDNPDKEDIEKAMKTSLKKKLPFISVNVVDLKCKKCEDPVKNFMDLENHLIEKHEEPLPDTDDPIMIPFKIGNGLCICPWCNEKFGEYNTLSIHMNIHYPNYICGICDAGFVMVDRLNFHEAEHLRRYCQKEIKKLNIIENEMTIKITDVWSQAVIKTGIDETNKHIDESKTQETNPRKLVVRTTEVVQIKENRLSPEKTPPETAMQSRENTIKNAVILIQNSTILPFIYNSEFRCIYCYKVSFGDIEKLQEHDSELHANPSEEMIEYAFKTIKPKQILKVNVVNLGCKLCDSVIKDFEELKTHLCVKHGKALDLQNLGVIPFKIMNGIFKCAICGVTFGSCQGLCYHMNEMHYKNYVCDTFACDLCRKKLKSVISLNNHKRLVHEGLKSVTCPYCEECFHDYNARQEHIAKVHSGSNASTVYKCGYCSYSCVTNNTNKIRKHVTEVHKKEKPYSCPGCDKKFFLLGMLQEHLMEAHVGMSFECEYCSKKYTNKNELTKHVRIAHAGVMFTCGHCGREFVLKKGLEAHMVQNHISLFSQSTTK